MLDDGDGWRGLRRELGDQLDGRVGVGDVVVGQRLALHHAGGGDAGPRVGEAVEGRVLVRVLAVAHGLDQRAGDALARRPRLARLAREPGGDRGVVGGRAGIGAGGEALAQRQIRRAVGFERRQHLGHVLRCRADRDVGVVLRRRANHRRPANVDVLDAGREVAAGGDRLLERVEAHVEQVDAADAVLGHSARVLGRIPHAQEAAMDDRMQRLDPPVHHLRITG